jgi:hypothetical protein
MTGRILLWTGVLVVLVAVPAGVNSARASEYKTSIEAFPVEIPGLARAGDTGAYVGSLLDDPLVATETADASGFLLAPQDVRERVHLRPTGQSVLVTVTAETPERARALAVALASALGNASVRAVVAEARAEGLDELAASPPFGIAIGLRPAAPRPTRLADRAVDRLPGAFPPRPHPLVAGGVGLVLAAALFAVAEARRRWY